MQEMREMREMLETRKMRVMQNSRGFIPRFIPRFIPTASITDGRCLLEILSALLIGKWKMGEVDANVDAIHHQSGGRSTLTFGSVLTHARGKNPK